MSDDGVKNGSGEGEKGGSAAPTTAHLKRGRLRAGAKSALRDFYVVLASVLLEVRVRAGTGQPMSGTEVAMLLDSRLRVWKEMYL